MNADVKDLKLVLARLRESERVIERILHRPPPAAAHYVAGAGGAIEPSESTMGYLFDELAPLAPLAPLIAPPRPSLAKPLAPTVPDGTVAFKPAESLLKSLRDRRPRRGSRAVQASLVFVGIALILASLAASAVLFAP